jgi:hypothetical protein
MSFDPRIVEKYSVSNRRTPIHPAYLASTNEIERLRQTSKKRSKRISSLLDTYQKPKEKHVGKEEEQPSVKVSKPADTSHIHNRDLGKTKVRFQKEENASQFLSQFVLKRKLANSNALEKGIRNENVSSKEPLDNQEFSASSKVALVQPEKSKVTSTASTSSEVRLGNGFILNSPEKNREKHRMSLLTKWRKQANKKRNALLSREPISKRIDPKEHEKPLDVDKTRIKDKGMLERSHKIPNSTYVKDQKTLPLSHKDQSIIEMPSHTTNSSKELARNTEKTIGHKRKLSPVYNRTDDLASYLDQLPSDEAYFAKNYKKIIKNMFRRKHPRHLTEEDNSVSEDLLGMEARFEDIEEEERRSEQIARQEDAAESIRSHNC